MSICKQDTFLQSFQAGPIPLSPASQSLPAWSISSGLGSGGSLYHLPPRTTSCLCIHHQGWTWTRSDRLSVSNESLWLFDLFIMLSGKSTNFMRMSLPSRFSAAMSYSSPVGCSYTVNHIWHLYKAAALREITCHYLGYEPVLLIKPLKPARHLGGRKVWAGAEAGSARHTHCCSLQVFCMDQALLCPHRVLRCRCKLFAQRCGRAKLPMSLTCSLGMVKPLRWLLDRISMQSLWRRWIKSFTNIKIPKNTHPLVTAAAVVPSSRHFLL